jgi:nucleoside-diphosphate-sugar epimerase
MKVLITGTEGYIGSRLAPWMVARGHEVVGLDIGYYRDAALYVDPIDMPVAPHTIYKDLRSITREDLAGFDTVIHPRSCRTTRSVRIARRSRSRSTTRAPCASPRRHAPPA